jgi:hypothetical protein
MRSRAWSATGFPVCTRALDSDSQHLYDADVMLHLARYRLLAVALILALLGIDVALPVVQGACTGGQPEAACADCGDCCSHSAPAVPGSPAVADAGCACAFVPADSPGPEGTPSQTPATEHQRVPCVLLPVIGPSAWATGPVSGIPPGSDRTLPPPDIPLRNSSLLL